MNLKYNYWYFQGVIRPEICDRIIAIGNEKRPQLGQIDRVRKKKEEEFTDEEIKDLKETRDSHVAFLDTPWIFNILKPWIHQANESAGWNFQWDWTEMLQFTKYDVGQFYDWHPDQHHYVYPEDDTNENMRGKYRKLSTTLLLNDPNEFTGGELEFHFNRTETKVAEELSTRGTLVVFPAFVYHRVREVTEGTRYSLVSWSIGAPFR